MQCLKWHDCNGWRASCVVVQRSSTVSTATALQQGGSRWLLFITQIWWALCSELGIWIGFRNGGTGTDIWFWLGFKYTQRFDFGKIFPFLSIGWLWNRKKYNSKVLVWRLIEFELYFQWTRNVQFVGYICLTKLGNKLCNLETNHPTTLQVIISVVQSI